MAQPMLVKENITKKGGRKQISCMECKRSKVKCNYTFPCSPCIKRDCANICPTGTLVPNKKILDLKTKKEGLQESIRSLQARSRALEVALRDAYRHVSSSPHPLLQRGSISLTVVKNSTNASSPHTHESDEHGVEDLLDAFGSLAIGDKGQTGYHASSSSAEVLLRSIIQKQPEDVQTSPISDEDFESYDSPPNIVRLANAFPYGTAVYDENMKRQILEFLPARQDAFQLLNDYFKSGSSRYPPIDESEFTASVLVPIFEERDTSKIACIHFHKVSALFMALAAATVLAGDLDDIDNAEQGRRIGNANQYYQIATAAFSVEYIGRGSSTWTVSTLLLMMHYSTVVEWEDREERWSLLGLLTRVVYSLGLQRDPSHWGLGEAECQRRRDAFWEFVGWEQWFSIAFGRPPSVNLSFTDCRFARDMEPGIGPNGEIELGFRAYLHRIMAFHVAPLMTFMFNIEQQSYAYLLNLDENFRNFECPSQLRCPTDGTGEPVDGIQWSPHVGRAFQQFYACVYFKESVLLYVHRKYVMRALKLNRHDPLQTKYRASILSSLKSARIILRTLRSLLGKHAKRTSRVPYFWARAFSAVFMLGGLVYSSPRCIVASEALKEFEGGVDMFIKFRSKEDRAGVYFTDVLQDLRAHVRKALQEGFPVTPSLATTSTRPREDAYLAVMRILEGESNLINKNQTRATWGSAAQSVLPTKRPNFNVENTIGLGENEETEQAWCGREEVQLLPLGPYGPPVHNDAYVNAALQTKLPEVTSRYNRDWVSQKDAAPYEVDSLESSVDRVPQGSTSTANASGTAEIENMPVLGPGMSAVLNDASWGVFFS